MIGIERNPEIINRIANSNGVREFVRPDEQEMDFTDIAVNPFTRTGVVPLSNGEDALGLFEITVDGVYQVHVLFAETCRGKRAVETGRAMIDYMFERGAKVIWGDVPRWNKPTLWFARKMGMRAVDSSDEDTEILEIRKTN